MHALRRAWRFVHAFFEINNDNQICSNFGWHYDEINVYLNRIYRKRRSEKIEPGGWGGGVSLSHGIGRFSKLRVLAYYAHKMSLYIYCPPKITIGLSASITFKIVNQSEYALGL